MIQFKLNKKKVVEALVYLATQRPRIDVFHVCKVLFYADRTHLRHFGRPILGDTYYAMDDGPVPSFALDVAKRNKGFVSQDILAMAESKLAVDESDGYVRLSARENFDDNSFSRTDIECLNEAIEKYADMPFLELWKRVHQEPEYKANYQGSGTSSPISFDAFIPANEQDREKKIEQLKEHARYTEL